MRRQNYSVYTDGREGEQLVGAGVVIFVKNDLTPGHKFRVNQWCSKKTGEQIAIVKALDLIKYLEVAENKHHMIGVYIEAVLLLTL